MTLADRRLGATAWPAPVRAGYSLAAGACERTSQPGRLSPDVSARTSQPGRLSPTSQHETGHGVAQGSLEYHEGGVRATSPDHEPDGDFTWCARPSNEMTGRMCLASHSPPATVK